MAVTINEPHQPSCEDNTPIQSDSAAELSALGVYDPWDDPGWEAADDPGFEGLQ